MKKLERKGKTYVMNDEGFLSNPGQWDEDFVEGMAPVLGVDGLTTLHWDVLKFIRAAYLKTGSCPVVHETCKAHNLKLKRLQRLFPSGYQRGACRLAGVSFMAEGVSTPFYPTAETTIRPILLDERVYRVNVQGFLIDPNEWDEDFAIFKSRELQMTDPLGEKHWQIVRYLRSEYKNEGEIPTVYATCEAADIDIDELKRLFPSGYHRGAVKIAGLNLAVNATLGAPIMAAPERS